MKYIGNSSPCWTIHKPEDTIDQRFVEVLEGARKYQHEVGPGKYADSSIKSLLRPPVAHRFEKSPKFSDPKFLEAMKPEVKRKLLKEELARKQSPNRLLRKQSQGQTDDNKKHYFSKSQRITFDTGEPEAPGPGTYELGCDIKKNKSPKFEFGYKGDESLLVSKSTSPFVGPGCYLGQPNLSGKGVVFGKSKRELGTVTNKTEENVSTPKISQICEGRESIVQDKENKPAVTVAKIKIPKRTFGRASKNIAFKQLMMNLSPGPGTYNIPESFKQNPAAWPAKAFTMSKKWNYTTSDSSLFPGPASYQPKIIESEKHAGYCFGRSHSIGTIQLQRNNMQTEKENVNADDLQQAQKADLKHAEFKTICGDIGKAPRLKPVDTCSPGPANYQINYDSVLRKMPEIKIKSRISVKNYKYLIEEAQHKNKLLEPNFQSIEPNSKGVCFGRSKKEVAMPIKKEEGVCQQINDNKLPIRPKGFKFGTEQKAALKKEESSELGPGFYELKQTFPQPQPWMKISPKFEFYGKVINK